LAASYQHTINFVLSTKLIRAAKEFSAKEIHLVGGVSANLDLRQKIQTEAAKLGITFRHPNSFDLCTDNAAMIAAAGYYVDLDLHLEPGQVPKLISWD
jgi:N6-L-threonylcarbamoyladenine synthase